MYMVFTSVLGGALVGASATVLLACNGCIAGISGIVNGLQTGSSGDRSWRIVFLLGLVGAAAAASVISSVGLYYRRPVGRLWDPNGQWLHQWSWRDGTWPPIAALFGGGPGIHGLRRRHGDRHSPPRESTSMNKALFFALLAGALFGAGLVISGMTDPRRVIGFLNVFGEFDPRLAFVLGGAVLVTLVTFRLVFRMRKPIAALCFDRVHTRTIDRPLIIGSLIFGVGWGIGGYCPGPAIADLASGRTEAVWFVLAMLLGSTIHRVFAVRQGNEGVRRS